MNLRFLNVLRDKAGGDGGAGDGGAGAGGSGDPGDGGSESGDDKPKIDHAEFEKLKTDFAAAGDLIKKLEANNQALLKEKSDAKKKADQAAMEAAKKSGNIDTIERSWSEKYSALELEKEEIVDQLQRDKAAAINQYETMIHNLTVGVAASNMAADIAVQGSAGVLLPHIKSRLTVEIRDGRAVTKVLDKDGRASAMTIDDLKKELMTDKQFAPIISGTKASGTGYKGGDWSNGSGKKTITRIEFNGLDQGQRRDFFKSGGEIVDS